jgi:hypothetical protein
MPEEIRWFALLRFRAVALSSLRAPQGRCDDGSFLERPIREGGGHGLTRAHLWVALGCVVASTALLARAVQASPAVALGGVLVGAVAYCAYCMVAAGAQIVIDLLAPAPRHPLLARTWILGNTTEGACARVVLLTVVVFAVLQRLSSGSVFSAGGLVLLAAAALFAPAMRKVIEKVLIPRPARFPAFVAQFPRDSRTAVAATLQAEVEGMQKSYDSRAMELTTWLLSAIVIAQKVVDGLVRGQPH